MGENTLSVLKIAPGQHPQQVEIDNDLKALQQAVGGSIGASYGRTLGYLFCYKSVWNKRAACIGTMQNKWGLGIAQQAFLQSKIAFV